MVIAMQRASSRLQFPRLHPGTIAALVVLLLMAVFLAITPWMMSEREHRHLFSDEGAVEIISTGLWMVLAGLALVRLRPVWQLGLAGTALALACAAREASWHKEFTNDHTVLRPDFFLENEFGIVPKLIAGTAILILAWSVVVVGVASYQRAVRDGWLRAGWVQVAAVGLGLLVVTKVIDRAPGVITKMRGVDMEYPLRGVLYALEEGFEMVLPLLFAIALFAAPRRRGGSVRKPSTTSRV